MNKNPVSKARIIVEKMTDNIYIQNKLLGIITRNIPSNEIDEIYNKMNNNQLKLEL